MYKATAAILRCELRIRDSPARMESAARVIADAQCGANCGSVRSARVGAHTHTYALTHTHNTHTRTRRFCSRQCVLPLSTHRP